MPTSIDPVDARRIRLARTTLAAFAAALLWAMFGIEWVQAWCAGACRSEDLAAFAVPVAWSATAAVVAGRAAWSWRMERWLPALALLCWTAWCVLFPVASAGLLAGALMRGALTWGVEVGFFVHGIVLAVLHLGAAWIIEAGMRRVAAG